METGLSGSKVIVTAGAGGIGFQIARAFLAEGAVVEICDVDHSALERCRSELPKITTSYCDVSDRKSCRAFMDQALSRLGGLDVLVNNAGIAGPTAAIDQIDPADWDKTLAVNLTGMFNITRLAVSALKESGNPSIICLASAAGRLGMPLRLPYVASKFGVVGFAKALAMELGSFGIRVNSILPGSVDGPRIQSVFANKAKERNLGREQVQEMALAASSLKRLIPPTDIAGVAVFLASTVATTLSGQALAVDGDLQMLV